MDEQNIPPVQAPLPAQPNHKKQWVITASLVLLIALVGLFIWKTKQPIKSSPENNPVTVGGNVENTPTTTPEISTTTPETGGIYDPVLGQQCKNRLSVLSSKSGLVLWQNPKRVDDLHIFPSEDSGGYGGFSDTNYKVGVFTEGKYKGGDFIISLVSPDGPSPIEYYRVARLNGKLYHLGKYSNELPKAEWNVQFLTPLTEDNDFDLPDLDFPTSIHSQNPSADLSYSPSAGFFYNGNEFFCADDLVKVFTDAVVGDVYTDAATTKTDVYGHPVYTRNGFYVKAPDSTLRTYEVTIPLIGGDKVPLVSWNGSSKNTDEYSYQAVGGCGVSKFRDVADVSSQDLTPIGTAFDGSVVYGYKNAHDPELEGMYNSIYTPEGQTKPTYNTFLLSHPIFFWQDPFGKYIRFKVLKYQPMAECAKPVIYLYPTKTQKLHVQVSPQGGMLVSDPDYGNGWNVTADPLGNITNLADGKTYPYLFWEGRGGMYETPRKGFVIKASDVHSFLGEKLHALGLNAKESADFMEFWEPKIQGAPYYFVTFMGNEVMDSLAPLSITPKPDTVIRVLMDFTPLEHPIPVQGYTIRTPERKGFTVVEWGGVLK